MMGFLKPYPKYNSTIFSRQGFVDISKNGKYNTDMEKELKAKMTETIRSFHLPRYVELPNVGLYLEQTTEYINGLLKPQGCMEITGSMISNYVKKGLIANPIKKQYYADQIAHLIVVTILKHVLSLENINALFVRQQGIYTNEIAYNYFCMELENLIYFQFGLKDSVDAIGRTFSLEKQMLRSAIIAVSHIIYLNNCFEALAEQEELSS